jgi:hypothetical protein
MPRNPSSTYINGCYKDNEDVASFVDRYVLRGQQAIRLILLRVLCEMLEYVIQRNVFKSITEFHNRCKKKRITDVSV